MIAREFRLERRLSRDHDPDWTASGVFGEMQTALNKIWKAKPESTTVSRLIRARAASLCLVQRLI